MVDAIEGSIAVGAPAVVGSDDREPVGLRQGGCNVRALCPDSSVYDSACFGVEVLVPLLCLSGLVGIPPDPFAGVVRSGAGVGLVPLLAGVTGALRIVAVPLVTRV